MIIAGGIAEMIYLIRHGTTINPPPFERLCRNVIARERRERSDLMEH